jgi:hypothetical protein
VQNNVLTDRAGNVYQRADDGHWSQRSNDGQWDKAGNLDRAGGNDYSSGLASRPTQQPSYSRDSMSRQQSTRPQLERDYSARQQGMNRSQSFQRHGGGRRR